MSMLRGKLSCRFSGVLYRSVFTSIAVLLASTTLQTGCLSRSLTSITIQPGTGLTTVVPGVSAQFKCYGTYTESGHAPTTQDVTSMVSWSSTIPAVATVTSAGVATGVAPGQTNIIATIQGEFGKLTSTSNIVVSAPASTGGGSGSTSGTVARTLTGVTVIPGSQTLAVTGQTSQLLAIGTYNTSPTSVDLTSQVSWQSSNTSVATVTSAGLVTGVGVGAATITALATSPDGSQLAGTATISVQSGGSSATRTLLSLNITPGSQTLATTGQTAQLLAVGTYNLSPLTANLTGSVQWQSSDPSVATVNTSGLVTAVGQGSATITALATASDGSIVSGSSVITVTGGSNATRTLTALNITPGSQTLSSPGQTAQLIAVGTYNIAPLTANLTSTVQWQTSDAAVATVNTSGVVTGVGAGSTTITAIGTATDGSVVIASATITVTAAGSVTRTLMSLSLVPASQSLTYVGETAQYLAIGTYNTSPLTVDLTNQVTWISSDVSVATVNNAGLATAGSISGQSAITAIMTATDGSAMTASSTLQVSAPSAGPGTGGSNLPTLAIYGAGQGSGTVTGPDAISCSYTGPSTIPGTTANAGCTGTFTVGTIVTLTAAPAAGSVFDGWSSNCTPSDASGNTVANPKSLYCTLTINNNTSVGAIFDPQ